MLTRIGLFAILVLTCTSGCVSWFSKIDPPEVLITNVTPLDSTPFEQRLDVELRVRNPNDYDLQVTGLDFRLDVNKKRLARGLGNKAFTIPRLGDATVTIETSTSMLDVMRQILSLRNTQTLTYGVSGVLYLNDGKLSFENSGVLVEKGDFPGIPVP